MPSDLSCPTVIQIMWPGIDTTEWVTITTIKILIFTNNLKTLKIHTNLINLEKS